MSHKKKPSKTLTISIHGSTIDVEAKFKDDTDFGKTLADAIKRITTPQIVEPPDPPEHDYDIIQRVIAHAPADVLQSIIDLATHAMQQRHPPQ